MCMVRGYIILEADFKLRIQYYYEKIVTSISLFYAP